MSIFPQGKNILSDNDNGACYVALNELRGDAGQRRCNSKKKLTYAEVLKSNNANISSQLISKSSNNPKENCDEMLSNTSTDGFVGVQRKRKKFKSFFVSGISEHVKEKQISSYLSRRNVIPSHISVFPSKRKGTISAKIGIPIASVSKVQEKTFWPMYVYCKPWRQNGKRKPIVQRINNMPPNGGICNIRIMAEKHMQSIPTVLGMGRPRGQHFSRTKSMRTRNFGNLVKVTIITTDHNNLNEVSINSDRVSDGKSVKICNHGIALKIRDDLNDQFFECLWVTIRPKWLPRSISRIALGYVYLPSSLLTSEIDNFYDYFITCYDKVYVESPNTAIILGGDFNPASNGFQQKRLERHCNLKQIVMHPTRDTSTLDLIFTNMADCYQTSSGNCRSTFNFGPQHHYLEI